MRQLIIARKDLGMSVGKLVAQCYHASKAFLTSHLWDRVNVIEITDESGKLCYRAEYVFSKDVYEDWICSIFTKTVCAAKNRNHLLNAKTMADEMGLEEGKNFFLIRDRCLMELVGRSLPLAFSHLTTRMLTKSAENISFLNKGKEVYEKD